MKLESAPTIEKYIYEVLKTGGFDIGKTEQKGDWEESQERYEINKCIVYMDYVNWCECQKLKPEKEMTLGKAIKKIIPSVDNEKRSHRDYGRKPMYEFPKIIKARFEFEKAYKVQGASEIWK